MLVMEVDQMTGSVNVLWEHSVRISKYRMLDCCGGADSVHIWRCMALLEGGTGRSGRLSSRDMRCMYAPFSVSIKSKCMTYQPQPIHDSATVGTWQKS